MSNDAQRLPDAALTVHSLWSTPIFLIAAIALLVQLVGTAAIAGIVFLVCMIPFQGYLATKQMGLQRAQMKQTESRVRVINEVLQVKRRRSPSDEKSGREQRERLNKKLFSFFSSSFG